jgi:hypothetical protein
MKKIKACLRGEVAPEKDALIQAMMIMALYGVM